MSGFAKQKKAIKSLQQDLKFVWRMFPPSRLMMAILLTTTRQGAEARYRGEACRDD